MLFTERSHYIATRAETSLQIPIHAKQTFALQMKQNPSTERRVTILYTAKRRTPNFYQRTKNCRTILPWYW